MAARPTPYEDALRSLVAGGNVVPRHQRGLQYASLVLLNEVDELMGERDAFHDLLVVSCVVSQFRISGLGVVELPHSVEDQVGPIALLLQNLAQPVRVDVVVLVEFSCQRFCLPPGAETHHLEAAIMLGVPLSR